MNIRTKLLINTVAPTLVVALAILMFNAILFSDFVDEAMIDRVNTASNIAEHHLQDLKAKAVAASLSVANNREILRALTRDDREALFSQAAQMREKAEIDFCTITDPEGRVIVRLHEPERYGDLVTEQPDVQAAMAGKSMTAVEKGFPVRLSVRSGAPIIDDQGAMAGIVLVGYRMDIESYVDVVKKISGCEISVYLDDERVATTVLQEDGTRAVGTKVSARLSDTVLSGNTFAGRIDILGQPAVVRCTPISGPDGQVVGMMLAGRYIDDATELILRFAKNGLLITLALLALAVGAILVIVRRMVTPIQEMTRAASALAVGDINIEVRAHTNDEMRTLAGAFAGMIESTRHQVRIIEQIASGDMTDPLLPRSENDLMNRALMKLNETLRAQAVAIRHRDKLLRAVNHIASILLSTADSENFEAALEESMRHLGQCMDIDRIQIWNNETVDDSLRVVLNHEWRSDGGRKMAPPARTMLSYASVPGWEDKFLRGESLNGPFSSLSRAEQDLLVPFGVKSIIILPLFLNSRFWGLFSCDDCRRERYFLEDEVDILRSASLMMAAAVNRNAQAANIRSAHHRNRLMTNATPLGFNLWDRTLRNIETNDTAVKLFGLENQQEYLARFFDLSPERQPDGSPSKEKAIALVHEAFEAGYLQFEWLHRKTDGTPVPSEVTLVRLAYGGDHVVAGYIRDLREYKKMLAAIDQRDKLLQTANQVADTLLRAEPDDFSSILHQCMGMMARAINADRMYIFKNHDENGTLLFTQMFEWAEEVQPFQDTSVTTDSEYRERFRETLLRGECVHNLIRGLSAADREHFRAQGILAILLVPVFIHNEFWGVVGFDNCHSEQLFTENEESIMRSGSLLIVNALLRNEYMHSIRDTSAKLEIALADAKEANNTKSNFLAHMSHEIRTPLNAVIGLSELTLGEGLLPREAESNLEKIYSAGSTILSLVNDILDISKIESGKFELHPVRYDTPSLINDTVTLNIVRIQEKPVTFALHVDENLPGELYGDDLRVKQIFNNLLSNAFKFTDSGTVEWRLSFEREADAVWLVSSVRDTGQGITPENLQKLFADYSQVNVNANRRVEGTGLGLAITRYLVEMMDGTITVESEYGKGSAFHVRLRQAPLSSRPIGREVAGNLMDMHYTLARRARYTKLTRVNLSYAHVLLVDDIETNLDVVKGMLKPYALQIDCAISGRQAVDMIRAESPRYDAVFMDHMMPGMDGIEATQIIRKEIGTDYARNIPIIALTANAIVGNEEMFLDKGFQAFISKPIDVMKLDSVLRRWVRDKDREKELSGMGMGMGMGMGAYSPGSGKGNGGNGNSLLGGMVIDGVDIHGALERFGGSETVFIDVLRSYAANVRPLLRSLPEYLAAESFTDYGIVVHGIKGSSYGIEARRVGKEAELLEHAVKSGNFDAVRAGHPVFVAVTETLIADIDAALDKIGAAVRKPGAAEPSPAFLRELREACAAFDMDRADKAMAQLESFRYERGGEIVAWLREQIDMMNFEKISGGEWPSE